MEKLKKSSRALVFLITLLGVVSCDKVVSEKVDVGREYVGTASCMGPGFCTDYGYSFNGNLGYKPGFKPFCKGTQAAILQDVWVTKTYKSGTVIPTKRVRVVRTTGSCEVGGMVNENRSRDI